MDNKELDKSRAEFEAWAEGYFMCFVLHRAGEGYASTMTQAAWEAWQAALARAGLAAPTEPTFSEHLDKLENAMWRMFKHGEVLNDSAARDEVHALRVALAAPTGQQAEPVAIHQIATKHGFAWSDVSPEVYEQYSGPAFRHRIVYAAPVSAAPTNCVGCEGRPSAENSPCGVCGQGAAPTAAEEPTKRLREQDVRMIALKHASSCSVGEYYEFDRMGLDAFALELMDTVAAPIPQKEGTSEQDAKDAELLDWLNERPVHFIELDDFSIIDVAGRDVRAAVRAAMPAAQAQPKDTTENQQ